MNSGGQNLAEGRVFQLGSCPLHGVPHDLVEGEHFLGGKQNRTVNTSVLVPALSDLEIPVSCLERSRWGRPRAARRDEEFTAAAVRAANHAGVAPQCARACRPFVRGVKERVSRRR